MGTEQLESQLITLNETLQRQIELGDELSTTVHQEMDEVLVEVEVNRLAINTKVNKTVYDSRVSWVDIELGKRADNDTMIAALATKCDVSEYNARVTNVDASISALETDKADKIDVDAALLTKSDKIPTNATLDSLQNNKADITYTDQQDALKADKTSVDSEFAIVNTELLKRADKTQFDSYVAANNSVIATKLDTSIYEAGIITKVNIVDYQNETATTQSLIDTKANQTFVVSQLDTMQAQVDLKAEKTYVDQQDLLKVDKTTYNTKMTSVDAILAAVVDDAEFATEIEDLTDVINTKADAATVNAALDTKANESDVNDRFVGLKFGGLPLENTAVDGSCSPYPGNPASMNEIIMSGFWDYGLHMGETPSFSGAVLIIHDGENNKISQVAFGTDTAKIGIRVSLSGVWSNWVEFMGAELIQLALDLKVNIDNPVLNGAVNLWGTGYLDGADDDIALRLNQTKIGESYRTIFDGVASSIIIKYVDEYSYINFEFDNNSRTGGSVVTPTKALSLRSDSTVTGKALANDAEALNGVVDNKLMTPKATRSLTEHILYEEFDIEHFTIGGFVNRPVYSFDSICGTIMEDVQTDPSRGFNRNGKRVIHPVNEACTTVYHGIPALLVRSLEQNIISVGTPLTGWIKESSGPTDSVILREENEFVVVNYIQGSELDPHHNGIITPAPLPMNSQVTIQVDIQKKGSIIFGLQWEDVSSGNKLSQLVECVDGEVVSSPNFSYVVERFVDHNVITFYGVTSGIDYINHSFKVTSDDTCGIRDIHIAEGRTSGNAIMTTVPYPVRQKDVISQLVDFDPLEGTVLMEFGINDEVRDTASDKALITLGSDDYPEYLGLIIRAGKIVVIDHLDSSTLEIDIPNMSGKHCVAFCYKSDGTLAISVDGSNAVLGAFTPSLKHSDNLRVWLGHNPIRDISLDGYIYTVDCYNDIGDNNLLASLSALVTN